jgi:ATP-dependent Clp protease adapter protein ClpS
VPSAGERSEIDGHVFLWPKSMLAEHISGGSVMQSVRHAIIAALLVLVTVPAAVQTTLTAHRRGTCVVAVYARDVAETKATRATEAGRSKGYPLTFTTEPEE